MPPRTTNARIPITLQNILAKKMQKLWVLMVKLAGDDGADKEFVEATGFHVSLSTFSQTFSVGLKKSFRHRVDDRLEFSYQHEKA